jgi:hypothetical protein
MSSIFVQLAAYHDYELPVTINDILDKASGNNQINIGVYLCYHEKEDIQVPSLPNVKVKTAMAPEGIGLGYSRLQAHNFYDGEDYYLQVDSHTKMDKNWDQRVIGDIKKYQELGFKKPLLTCYPRNYKYLDDGSCEIDQNDNITQIRFSENPHQFESLRIPTQTAFTNENGNIFSNSISGGSVATVGGFITPNPRVAFYGEEIFIAARAFTNGFDLLLPEKLFMSHLYFDHNRPEQSLRRLIWKDYPEEFSEIDAVSKKEIFDTLSNGIVGPEYLGSERSIEEYGMRCGLDFKTGVIHENC